MCGICGFVTTSRPDYDPDQVLRAMMTRMAYRGPDESGTWSQPGVWLGHQRLNIVDLSTGQQPMGNEDGRVVTAFNGEIFNHLELREGLEKGGHQFRTRSDTEVLVHLWEELGTGVPEQLNGMFAISIWDQQTRRLFLARDRMGQKPLYYAEVNHGLIFSSELASLMAHPAVSRDLDPVSLRQYLLFSTIPAPATILSGVRKLEPGTWLLWEEGQTRVERYWDINFPPRDQRPPSIPDAADQLRSLLKDSIKKRLMSDVPLGVFLSGGLDSSTLVALLNELVGGPNVETFSIGFSDKSYDETSYAQTVARKFRTRHHHKELSPSAMLERIPRIMGCLDEPLADGSLIPTFLLSETARKKVTVALGGDGGDELLLGYPTFKAHKIASIYSRLPNFFKPGLKSLVNRLPVSMDNVSFDYQAKSFLRGMDYDAIHRHFVWIGAASPEQHHTLLTPDTLASATDASVFGQLDRHISRVAPRDQFDLLSYVYSKIYMGDTILTKVDRASMMNSLEVRAPFLDYRVVEFLTGLPSSYKLRGFNMKYILKKAMARDLPPEIIKRPKKGFGVPLGSWIRGDLRRHTLDLLSRENLRRVPMLNPDGVTRLLADHLEGIADNRRPLWAIMVLMYWAETNL